MTFVCETCSKKCKALHGLVRRHKQQVHILDKEMKETKTPTIISFFKRAKARARRKKVEKADIPLQPIHREHPISSRIDGPELSSHHNDRSASNAVIENASIQPLSSAPPADIDSLKPVISKPKRQPSIQKSSDEALFRIPTELVGESPNT